MAVTYRGAAATSTIDGNGATTQNLAVLENPISSGVNVYVRRAFAQIDADILTAVMPLVSTSRITTFSGGIGCGRGEFDSAQSPSGVRLWSGEDEITATPGTTVWEQFSTRQHTGAGQVIGADQNLLPVMVADTGKEFVLRPGQHLLVTARASAASSNLSTLMHYVVAMAWDESTVTTFTISGVVTISGTPRNGAEVVIIVADDNAMTNAYLHSVQVTAGSGNWSAAIPSGKVAFAYSHDDVSGTLYTAPGRPFNT